MLHGAGYTGGELIRLLLNHPYLDLIQVTSRTFNEQPLWAAHPDLRGQTDLLFSNAPQNPDAIICAAEHKHAVSIIPQLVEHGFTGPIVDLSADFRFKDPDVYPQWFNFPHPVPEYLDVAQYGLPELLGPYSQDVQLIANPGCFATGIILALAPIARNLEKVNAAVTGLTGASGSGVSPSTATHFPARDGNVRSYKTLEHQHVPEIESVLPNATIHFVPCSGPWTRGIWGTIHVDLPVGISARKIASWFENLYFDKPAIRLWPNVLPELLSVVSTPFCDIGWLMKGRHLVIGFALDNLLKGASSQAIQNLNLVLGLPEMSGLLPASAIETPA